MNTFRRGLLAAHAALLAILAGVLLVLANNQDRKLDIDIGSFSFEAFIDAGDPARFLFTLLMGLVMLLAFIVIAIAFWPDEPHPVGVIRVRRPDGTVVEVDAAGVEEAIREEVGHLPDVTAVDVRATLYRRFVETSFELGVYPGTSLALVTTAVGDTVARVLREEFDTGGPRPRLRVTYDAISSELYTSDAAANPRPSFHWPDPLPAPPQGVQRDGDD